MIKKIFVYICFIFLFFLISCNCSEEPNDDESNIGNATVDFINSIYINECEIKKLELPSDSNSRFYQGFSQYNNYFFRLMHGGKCDVYQNNRIIDSFSLGSYNYTNQHANCCNFSNIFIDNNEFPLLYVTGGNDENSFECDVEFIIYENDNFSSTCVQKIFLNQENFSNEGLISYWGWPCWLIDHDYLYCFGTKYRTNGTMSDYDNQNMYIITKFLIPNLNNENVIISEKDVLEQWTVNYDVSFTQGGTISNGYIFFAFGCGTKYFPSIIKVFSLTNHDEVYNIYFDNTSIWEFEFEDLTMIDDILFLSCSKYDELYSINLSSFFSNRRKRYFSCF